MLSRVAENLYWLGRHLERAENIARMARVEHEVSLESGQEIWHSLVSTTASNQLFWDTLIESPDLTHSEFLIYSMQNPASLRSTLVRARELALGLREHISREVWEEAGIRAVDVRYHSSQPWPFPSSLMIGCHAKAATTDIHKDDEEMTDVRWFSRAGGRAALAGQIETLSLPGPFAIAHHLIRSWAEGQAGS